MDTGVKNIPLLTSVLGLAARVGLGTVMLVAGAVKLPDPAGSVHAVRAYQALPEMLVSPVGYLLPLVEVAVGALLIVGLFTKPAAAATAGLQAVFIAGIAWAWANGLEIDCGCFGGGGEKAGASSAYPFDIARDVGFIVLAAAAWAWPVRRISLERFLFGADDDELAHGGLGREVLAYSASSLNRGDTE